MSGLREVDCSGCGRRHTMSADQARKQRVLRCACGQFVRMDRALADRRSEPAPAFAPPQAAELAQARSESNDQQPRLLDSFGVTAGGRPRSAQPSLSGREPKSQPPPRARMLSLSPAPYRHGSEPPTEKPLWYVDLGGIETVEMTIEQLIIARRSGKLGEGALVWRTGMPSWRPVGTLIPAAPRATPTPPRASDAPPRASDAPPRASDAPPPLPPPPPARLAPPAAERAAESPSSYERPIATLEFALERAVPDTRESARPPTPPGREQRVSQPRRALTPVPPRPSSPLLRSAPIPIPKPASWTSSASVVAPLPIPLSRLPAATAPVTLPPLTPSNTRKPVSERPRWLTASLALLLCVAASGSGAFLVRALRVHRQPAQLSPAPSMPNTAALAASSAQTATEPFAPVVPQLSAAPRVVDIASLTVEHKPPRVVPRPAAQPAPRPESSVQPDDERGDTGRPELAPAAPAATQTPKSDPLPPTTPPSDSAVKKTPSGDQPGF